MNKSLPVIRQCVVAREHLNKKEMFRVVNYQNQIVFDESLDKPGRGVYIKKDLEVIENAKRRNSFAKALKCNVNLDIYDLLIEALRKEKR